MATEGRERFGDFDRDDFAKETTIFSEAGHYRLGNIRRMQDNARTFFIANLRKKNTQADMIKPTHLVLGISQSFQTTLENAKDPKIEEAIIPREMKNWTPSLTHLGGLLVPGQDMVNHFTIELTRGQHVAPSYTPSATGDMAAEPWMPKDPVFPRSQGRWEKMQASHKRPSGQPISFQQYMLNYLRLVLAGDLAGAWASFGGLSAQMTHLGTLLAIASTENAMTAMAYDRAVRTTIETNSRKRLPPDQLKRW